MAEDFLAVANPALLQCFEEAERTFSLDKDDLDSSLLATDVYHHDIDSGEESSEESDGENVCLRSIRIEDATEDSTVEAFFAETCHCTLGNNNTPCSQALPRRYAVEYRDQCLELSKNELDIAVLGQLAALRRREPTLALVSDTARTKKRRVCQRPYTVFRFGDMVICKTTFLFLHALFEKRFKNLCHHFDFNGLLPRIHSNTNRSTHNTVPLEVTQRILVESV